MNKKYALLLLVVIFCFSLILASCQRQEEVTTKQEKKVKIRISGSGTCLPLVKILAAEYEKDNPNVKFDFLPGVHSGGGIKGVANDTLDLGTVSREFKPEEKEYNLRYYHLSDDPVAVGTHTDINIDNLSAEQIKDIYRGEITNWKEVGGQDSEIVVLDRNEDESAKIILRKYLLGKDLKITQNASNLYYESDMINGLIKTPNSIGYFSYGYVKSENLPINIISVDGVYPSVENASSGKFHILRPLGIVTKQKVSEEIEDFIDYAQSEEGKEVMTEHYFNPGF